VVQSCGLDDRHYDCLAWRRCFSYRGAAKGDRVPNTVDAKAVMDADVKLLSVAPRFGDGDVMGLLILMRRIQVLE
jgi:hypothetical protein